MQGEATGKRMEAEEHTRGESGWIPWRVAAAGVEEGGLLGAPPVARRALGGVQGWCVLKLKLGASIYRRLEGMAVNGDLR